MYVAPVKGQFASTLPDEYFSAMEEVVRSWSKDWLLNGGHDETYIDYMIKSTVFGRLNQMMDSVVPWLKAATPDLKALDIMEIGSGTGSATVGLGLEGRSVFSFDINKEAVSVARDRCKLFGLENVQLEVYDTSWIDGFAADPKAFFPRQSDVVFTYALFEHLTPIERIKLLRAIFDYLPVGGKLVTVELPNRLCWMDWHTSELPFADTLPDELASLYYAQSKRVLWPAIVAKDVESAKNVHRDTLYRLGRGMSYHEFYLAIDQRFRIVADHTSARAINRSGLPGADLEWQHALAAKLAQLDPPVPESFAAPCLDLILEKIA